MSKETILVVVRHGNTFQSGDVILRVGAATDIPLTEKGVLQGVAVGRELKKLDLEPVKLFTAPLMRTRRSAEGIAEAFPGVCTETAEFLTELDYGIDDGRPEDEVVLRLGIVEFSGRITPDTTIDELREAGKAALKRWDNEAVLPKAWAHIQSAAGALGEKWCQFGEKILAGYAGRVVVAVTSNGIARFSKALLAADDAPPENLKLATGAFGVYAHDGEKWHCRSWNVRPEL